ncbi:MAG TPA: hypothetical protein PLA90_04145 [Candidatus Sumerlaeota bacterium]|nr:hypothetical protein [Candidatus Sumerlaeota bacterium]
MRGSFKGLFILLAVGVAFIIPLFVLFFFFGIRVERREAVRTDSVQLDPSSYYPGLEQWEQPESIQIDGAGSGWQRVPVRDQTGTSPFTPAPVPAPVRGVLLVILFLCLLGGMFVALLIRVARGAGRPERRGMDPEIDMLAVRIHEKEEQLMRRLEALETLLVGELGRGSETHRG